jgi:hypothetical protein
MRIEATVDDDVLWLYALNSEGTNVSCRDMDISFIGDDIHCGVGIGGDGGDHRNVTIISGISVNNARVNITRSHYYTYSSNATIQASATYVIVTHLCVDIPTRNIWITPYGDIGGRSYWVSDVTSTTFRLNVNSTSAGYLYFNWGYSLT